MTKSPGPDPTTGHAQLLGHNVLYVGLCGIASESPGHRQTYPCRPVQSQPRLSPGACLESALLIEKVGTTKTWGYNVDIESILSKLAADSDRIVMNPAGLEQLLKQGVVFDRPPKRTIEESIDLLFSSRKQQAVDRAKQLPALPQMPPAVASLYQEIITSIIFGLFGAAITLSGILVEFVLKFCTYVREAGGYEHYDPEAWDKFENITFGPAIQRAARAGFINPTQVADLNNFKDAVRNPYNHYNIRKITASVVWEKVREVNLTTGHVEEKIIAAKDNIVFQAQAKPIVDQRQVFAIFGFADAVTRALLAQIQEPVNSLSAAK
jgi:hypothetical protein